MAPTGNCGKHVKNLQSDGTWLNMGAHPGISSAKKSAPARKTRIFCRKYPLRSPYRSGPWTEHANPNEPSKAMPVSPSPSAASILARVCGTLRQ